MALRFLQDVSQQAGLKPKELRAVHERWVHQRAVPLLTAAFSYSRCGAKHNIQIAFEQVTFLSQSYWASLGSFLISAGLYLQQKRPLEPCKRFKEVLALC